MARLTAKFGGLGLGLGLGGGRIVTTLPPNFIFTFLFNGDDGDPLPAPWDAEFPYGDDLTSGDTSIQSNAAQFQINRTLNSGLCGVNKQLDILLTFDDDPTYTITSPCHAADGVVKGVMIFNDGAIAEGFPGSGGTDYENGVGFVLFSDGVIFHREVVNQVPTNNFEVTTVATDPDTDRIATGVSQSVEIVIDKDTLTINRDGNLLDSSAHGVTLSNAKVVMFNAESAVAQTTSNSIFDSFIIERSV